METGAYDIFSKWDCDGLIHHKSPDGAAVEATIGLESNDTKLSFTAKQLFIAAITSNFLSCFISKAERSGTKITNLEIKATGVSSLKPEIPELDLIILRLSVTVNAEKNIPKVLSLIKKAQNSSVLINTLDCEVVVVPKIIVA